jgi:hypothetical protein
MEEADAALGRATRELFAAKAWRPASLALDFLAHRAMAAALAPAPWSGADRSPSPGEAPADRADHAAFARAAGAMVARRWLDDPSKTLSETERRRLAPIFDALVRTGAARELSVLTETPAAPPTPAA